MSRKGIILFMGLIFIIAFALEVQAINPQSASFITQQYSSPSFNTYYAGRVGDYWPILNDPDQCQARQDILLNIAPVGCEPTVVRSDLLAEQNVPVFCQLNALNVNPLINVNYIKNIVFSSSKYPNEVVSGAVGFHPALAALRSNNQLMGDPLVNNIGYAVVILKKQPNETALPSYVQVNLTATLEYESGNVLGVGKSEFVLEQLGDADFALEKFKQTFWNGKYSLRLLDLDQTGNTATVGIYNGDTQVASAKVNRGGSQKVYLPGSYCQATLNVEFVGFEGAQKKARIEVGNGNGVDTLEVSEGSTFLDGKCTINNINIGDANLGTGNIVLSCPNGKLSLSLLEQGAGALNIFSNGTGYLPISSDGNVFSVDFGSGKLGNSRQGRYGIGSDGSLLYFSSNSWVPATSKITSTNAAFLDQVLAGLREYKTKILSDPNFRIQASASKKYSSDVQGNLTSAFDSYVAVVKNYPSEMDSANKVYGQTSLQKAIDLAQIAGQSSKKIELMRLFVDSYPNTAEAQKYNFELQNSYTVDSGLSAAVVNLDGRYRTIRLVSLSEPSERPQAEFSYGNDPNVIVKTRDNITNADGRYIRVVDVLADRVSLYTNCLDVNNVARGGGNAVGNSLTMNVGQANQLCGKTLVFRKADLKQVARIRLTPDAGNTQTKTNLTIRIGIEKRAIQLTPEMAQEKITNLNETIKKWSSISKSLANVVSGLKGACFATAAILNIKNFFTGLGGEALARQKVMPYWTDACKKEMSQTPGMTMDACLLKHNSDINSAVSAETTVINNVNADIKKIQDANTNANLVGGTSINSQASNQELANLIISKHGDDTITLPAGKTINNKNTVTVKELLANQDSAIKSGVISSNDLREMYTSLESKGKTGFDSVANNYFDKNVGIIADRINGNLQADKLYKNMLTNQAGLPPLNNFVTFGGKSTGMQIVSCTSVKIGSGISLPDDYCALIMTNEMSNGVKGAGGASKTLTQGQYLLGLSKSGTDSNVYQIDNAYRIKDVANGQLSLDGSANYADVAKANLGYIQASTGAVNYNHPMQLSDQTIRYYETAPYKGMPAIVPFDVQHGWYVATKQTLPAGGGIGAFDASGKVSSFYLCNVMDNGIINFDQSNFGDDACQLFNTNTGMSLKNFGTLGETETANLVNKATKAIQDAARQYSSGGNVLIDGKSMKRGSPLASVPETKCQDFMSPQECNIMFNLCDPVICPASRCNLGGAYPVQDVIQSGIVGSALLCLPNAKEGIIMPVCLTGIQAGIDGYVSILKSYRDCLSENIKTGQMLGMCDQMYSLYSCDFFWRQMVPMVKALLPRLLSAMYGQGTRGGGEYLTVNAAWTNTQKSIDYFTNFYAINSFKALQYRSIDEAGGEICKAFVSSSIPTSLKSLTAPDSPVQFTANFDSVSYTSATIPATAQYKVFYHIFAGNDQGVSYRVYLKDPPTSGYYSANPVIQVATGFITKGQYKTETRDFTAPEGYKTLCVMINGDEKCGFKQVSTDFAVNYIRDVVVADQINQTNINSETECVSGSPNVGSLINSNLQSGLQNVVSPAVYRSGIIRICATQNPGLGSDPTRYVNVGNCGNANFGCWLDKNSVSNAITQNNLGLKNATLQDLAALQKNNLLNGTNILNQDDGSSVLNQFNGELGKISSTGKSLDLNAMSILLGKMQVAERMLVFNGNKANLLYLRGWAYDLIARDRINALPQQSVGVSGTTTAKQYLYYNGEQSQFYVMGDKIYHDAIIEVAGNIANGVVNINNNGIGYPYGSNINGMKLSDLGASPASVTTGSGTSGTVGTNAGYITYAIILSSVDSTVYLRRLNSTDSNVFASWEYSSSGVADDWASVANYDMDTVSKAWISKLSTMTIAQADAKVLEMGGILQNSNVASTQNYPVYSKTVTGTILYFRYANKWQWSFNSDVWSDLTINPSGNGVSDRAMISSIDKLNNLNVKSFDNGKRILINDGFSCDNSRGSNGCVIGVNQLQ